MALDEALLAEMRETKAAIDELQQKLKDLVTALRERGASSQEIAEAPRSRRAVTRSLSFRWSSSIAALVSRISASSASSSATPPNLVAGVDKAGLVGRSVIR